MVSGGVPRALLRLAAAQVLAKRRRLAGTPLLGFGLRVRA